MRFEFAAKSNGSLVHCRYQQPVVVHISNIHSQAHNLMTSAHPPDFKKLHKEWDSQLAKRKEALKARQSVTVPVEFKFTKPKVMDGMWHRTVLNGG